MGNGFTYYAFVSYSHKDQKWAEWIQNAIEHYRLPAIIRKEAQKQLPKRIAPVFRDATDLGVDVLVDGLHEELEKSRFLIVVCSPNSAKPNAEGEHFVDEEVRHFCELGRTKQVIPVIVEGTPEESFGPVLKSKDIKALDATKFSKTRILNDIVAKILGLKPDALWRRAERERRKRLIIRSILCSILGFFVAVAGYFAWDANRTVKNYYADYVDSFGLPEGLFPLKKLDLTHRHIHYRFEYKGFQYGKSPHADSADWCIWNLFGFRRRLVRVVQANSRGYPRELEHPAYSDRPQIQDFKYDEKMRLKEIRYGRFAGVGREPYMTKRIGFWNEGQRVNVLVMFFGGDSQLNMVYENAGSTTAESSWEKSLRTNIARYILTRDKLGRVCQCLYLDTDGEPTSDNEGVCGVHLENDEFGRMVVRENLSRENGRLVCFANKKGIARCKYEYSKSNLIRMEYLDENNELVLGNAGFMVRVDLFNKYNNRVDIMFLGDENNPAYCKGGFSGFQNEYNEFGDVIKRIFVNANHKPVLCTGGYAGWKAEYNECGFEVRRITIDVNGNSIMGSQGYAESRDFYDQYGGNIVKTTFHDSNGRVVSRKGGYAGYVMEYDKHGRMERKIYLGVDGNAHAQDDGYAEVRFEYDGDGRKTKQSYRGEDGKLTLTKHNGTAGFSYLLDKRGNVKRQSWFGTNEQPMLNSFFGCAAIISEYGKTGALLIDRLIGIDDKPVIGKGGFAEVHGQWDERGNVIKELYFGIDGKPKLCNAGCVGNRRWHDKFGNITNYVYLGADSKPIALKGGEAGYQCEYNEMKLMVRKSFYNTNGNLVSIRNEDGVYAEIHKEYNERCLLVKKWYLGVNGELVANKNGVAVFCNEYDDANRDLKVDLYAPPNKGGVWGLEKVHHVCRLYDTYGNITNETFWAVGEVATRGNNNAHRTCSEYRRYGNESKCVRERYFDADGKPTFDKSGAAGWMAEYDACGRKTRNVWIGVDDRPMLTKEGYAEYRKEYDDRGNVTKVSYFSVDGKEILPRKVITSTEIVPDSQAARLGVGCDDVWCQLGDVVFLENEIIDDEIRKLLLETSKIDRELIVARKAKLGYEILSFRFIPGPMGVHATDKTILDFDKVFESYKAYREKEKGEKK